MVGYLQNWEPVAKGGGKENELHRIDGENRFSLTIGLKTGRQEDESRWVLTSWIFPSYEEVES